jgi:hypothetical protein
VPTQGTWFSQFCLYLAPCNIELAFRGEQSPILTFIDLFCSAVVSALLSCPLLMLVYLQLSFNSTKTLAPQLIDGQGVGDREFKI